MLPEPRTKRSWGPTSYRAIKLANVGPRGCDLVGGTGIEPVTSSVSGKRSPAELTARRGGSGNRTRVQGFAGPCLSHSAIPPTVRPWEPDRYRRAERTVGTRDGFRHLRADDGIRTRDPHLGKVMLYQLSHVRTLTPARAARASSTRVRSETVADPGLPANSHTRLGAAESPDRDALEDLCRRARLALVLRCANVVRRGCLDQRGPDPRQRG